MAFSLHSFQKTFVFGNFNSHQLNSNVADFPIFRHSIFTLLGLLVKQQNTQQWICLHVSIIKSDQLVSLLDLFHTSSQSSYQKPRKYILLAIRIMQQYILIFILSCLLQRNIQIARLLSIISLLITDSFRDFIRDTHWTDKQPIEDLYHRGFLLLKSASILLYQMKPQMSPWFTSTNAASLASGNFFYRVCHLDSSISTDGFLCVLVTILK